VVAYRRVYDSRHLQADCQEVGSARQSSMGYLFYATLSGNSLDVAWSVCMCVSGLSAAHGSEADRALQNGQSDRDAFWGRGRLAYAQIIKCKLFTTTSELYC